MPSGGFILILCYTKLMQFQLVTEKLKLTPVQNHTIDKRLKKLNRLCQMFKPDAVIAHLKLNLKPPRQEYSIYLNLSVPSQKLAAHTRHKQFSIAIGQAFKKITSQLKKLRAKLRDQYDYAKVAKEKGKV